MPDIRFKDAALDAAESRVVNFLQSRNSGKQKFGAKPLQCSLWAFDSVVEVNGWEQLELKMLGGYSLTSAAGATPAYEAKYTRPSPISPH